MGFSKTVLPELISLIGGQSGGLISQRAGSWNRELWVGAHSNLPEALVSDALDRGDAIIQHGWSVTPLRKLATIQDIPMSATASALVIRLTQAEQEAIAESQARRERVKRFAALLASALERIETRDRHARRIDQLSAVLKAAAEWLRLDDDQSLLTRIADTATELLNCERASIFLWDRRRSKLIGRPALGIEGKPLEVDDDAGVVGEVLRSAEPKIWNANSDDESRVNRSRRSFVGV